MLQTFVHTAATRADVQTDVFANEPESGEWIKVCRVAAQWPLAAAVLYNRINCMWTNCGNKMYSFHTLSYLIILFRCSTTGNLVSNCAYLWCNVAYASCCFAFAIFLHVMFYLLFMTSDSRLIHRCPLVCRFRTAIRSPRVAGLRHSCRVHSHLRCLWRVCDRIWKQQQLWDSAVF